MKRKISLKLLALVMSVITVLCAFTGVPALAAGSVTPVIVISGMASFPLYVDTADKTKMVFGPETEDILKAVAECIVPIGKTAIYRDWSYLADGITKPVYNLFEYVACNEDGTSKYALTTPLFPKSVDNYPDSFENKEKSDDEAGIVKGLIDKIGGENVYYFNYDWRLDPLEHADDLKAYIDNVLREKNCSEVTLVPASMGGCIMTSYLYKYGTENIKSVIMTETAFLGTSVAGEVFNKKLIINTDTLLEYFYVFYQNTGFLYQTLFGLVSSCVELSTIDVEATLDKLFASLVLSLSDKLYDDVLVKIFGTMPGIWALVPNSYYEGAKKTMFPGGMNAALEKRTDEYQRVQADAKKLIDSAIASGTEFYFVASYGYVGFPAVETVSNQSDCLIDTFYESGLATCAPYGQPFGADYKAVGTVCSDMSHNHVSTDAIIDASSCMYPEKTWFIKANRHVGFEYGTGANELVVWLILADDAVDVHADERYPQFVKLGLFSGKLTSLTGDTMKQSILDKPSNIYTRLITFLLGVIEFLKYSFAK